MATLNGMSMEFKGLTFAEVGEIILEASPSGDGRGITMTLTKEEEYIFESAGGMMVGRSICNLIADAIKKKTGKAPANFNYRYHVIPRQLTTW